MCEFDIKWLFMLTVQKLTSQSVLFPNHFLHLFYFQFIQFVFLLIMHGVAHMLDVK